jgi:hypothetical protein
MSINPEDIILEQLPSERGEPYSYAATDNRTSITVVERGYHKPNLLKRLRAKLEKKVREMEML